MPDIKGKPYTLTDPQEQAYELDSMLDDLYRQLSDSSPTGDANSAVITDDDGELAYIPGVTAGTFVRFSATGPEWSTLVLPNAAVTGDILYASATDLLNRLADVATGNALISGGVGAAPSWGKIALTTHVSGVLPLANGGTGSSAFTAGSVVFSNGTILTQENATFFWNNTDKRLGLGTVTPLYRLDVRGISSLSQLHIASDDSDEGGYLTAFNAFDSFVVGTAAFNATNWIAKATTAALVSLDTGTVQFLCNSGLVAGNSYTPTVRGVIYPSGGAYFLGTPSDPGAGIFKIGGSLEITTPLAAAQGGTGQSTYAVGDLLYASTSSALSKLADVATGNALISGGIGVAPSWGKIALTTHVSGTLPVANGGTGATTFTNNRVLTGNGTSAIVDESGFTFDGTSIVVASPGPHVFGEASPTATQAVRFAGSFAPTGSTAIGTMFTQELTVDTGQSAAGSFYNCGMTKAGSGTHNRFATLWVGEFAIAGSGATVTSAATIYIPNQPSGATNNYALWVDAGVVRWDDAIALGGGAAPTLGTIGGSGPTAAAQNQWLRVNIGGTVCFLPVWV